MSCRIQREREREKRGTSFTSTNVHILTPEGLRQYPLNAAYVMAVADPAHFPIAWRDPNGLAVKIIAPNDGTFRPGPGAVLVKRVGGEEDVYAYKSLQVNLLY
jgi:hypothetical protein